MPELPDVEILKQYWDATSLHKEVKDVRVNDSLILEDMDEEGMKDALLENEFDSTRRHGKHLFVEIDSSRWLGVHFGMTGNLKAFKGEDNPPEYTQVLFDFVDGYHLAYVMPRKLGKMRLIDDPDSFIDEKGMGPDVLSEGFDFQTFCQVLSNRRGMIKSTLMNQEVMAGIGNVYSDEILYQARVHPKEKVNDLDEKRLQRIFEDMKNVLQVAIDHRAKPDQFPD